LTLVVRSFELSKFYELIAYPSKAVQSGLQRHFTEDFKAQVDEMMKDGRENSHSWWYTYFLLTATDLVDLDGTKFDFPLWTGRSEGAANIITGMIDPTISGLSTHIKNMNGKS
jgi:hypothetical protein